MWNRSALASSAIFSWKIQFTLATVARGAKSSTPVNALIASPSAIA